MKFSTEQIEEIEDRVNNLIQMATAVLELIASGDKVDDSDIRAARVDLRRLTRWTQELRPSSETFRGRRNVMMGYETCSRCGEAMQQDSSGRPRCMDCGYVTPERERGH